MQPVRAHDLLRHVIQSNQSDALARGLHLREEFRAEGDNVIGDPARLQQVFWNLLRNAVKFTPAGGRITIRTGDGPEPARLRIDIEDTGVGIPADLLPRVFDAFEQGDARTTRQFGGLGLGLAIAKAVVEMHGGTIAAASPGPDQGATFSVHLPTAPIAPAETSASKQAIQDPQAARQIRVLLVEDHPDTARTMARLLNAAGFYVRTANSVASALKQLSLEPFDVAVSDIGLPDASGYELMRQIRERFPTAGIALSGYGMEEDIAKSREAGFAQHLIKPVSIAQLEAALRRLTTAALTP
jgi:CheY-like chemotaxis protein